MVIFEIRLCHLAIKTAIVTDQNYGTFSAKVWHFWVQSVVVFGVKLWWRYA